MKHLQKFSKYFIWFSIIGIPILWLGLQQSGYLGKAILGTSPYQLFFDCSLSAVFFVMTIRPLADIFPQKKYLRKWVFLRKSLGIFSAMIIATVMLSGWIQNPDLTFFNYFSKDRWQFGYPITARISEITAIILLLTSNTFSMKKLGKNWKRVQRLAYPYFFSGAIIAARWEHTGLIYTSMAIVVLLWIWAEVSKYKKRA